MYWGETVSTYQRRLRKVTRAFLTSRLDHCNALLVDVQSSTISWLQRVHNNAACVLTKTRKYTPIFMYVYLVNYNDYLYRRELFPRLVWLPSRFYTDRALSTCLRWYWLLGQWDHCGHQRPWDWLRQWQEQSPNETDPSPKLPPFSGTHFPL